MAIVHLATGGIFSENSDDAKNAFIDAAQYFSRHVSDAINLTASTITVNTTDTYKVQKAGN